MLAGVEHDGRLALHPPAVPTLEIVMERGRAVALSAETLDEPPADLIIEEPPAGPTVLRKAPEVTFIERVEGVGEASVEGLVDLGDRLSDEGAGRTLRKPPRRLRLPAINRHRIRSTKTTGRRSRWELTVEGLYRDCDCTPKSQPPERAVATHSPAAHVASKPKESWSCPTCGTTDTSLRYSSGKIRRCANCQAYDNVVRNSKFERKHVPSPELNMTRAEYLEWALAQRRVCKYCGILESDLEALSLRTSIGRILQKLGVDRLDNERGYEIGNIALCCFVCNKTKSNVFTTKEMLSIGPIVGQIWAARFKCMELQAGCSAENTC